MITWIQLRTQKHLKLIFFFLLIVIVIPFVFTIGNQSFFGSHDDSSLRTKDFYGYNLASESTNNYLKQTAQVSAMLSREQMLETNHLYDTDRYANERAAAISMARMLGIAEPTEEQLRAYIRQKEMFQDAQGQFSATAYKNMIEFFETRQGIPEATLLKILSEDYRIERVRALLAGAGFINPEILALERQNMGTEWTVSVAKLSLASFQPTINADDATLKNFYETNKSRFEIRERLRLSQVRFPAVSFAGSVPLPTEAEIQAYFDSHKPRSIKKDEPEPVLDVVRRSQISQTLIQTAAAQLAAQKADEFTLALWRENLTYDSPRVPEFAKSMGGQVTPLEPFAKGAAPKNRDASADQLDELWMLTTSERYFSDVISNDDGASVFLYQGTIPSRMPSFEEVAAQVKEEFTNDQRNIQFVARGKELQKAVQADLDAGKSFDTIAKTYGLTTESFVNVKIESADRALLRDGGPLDVASRLTVGRVSAMQIDDNGGSFVYLQNKVVPPLDNVRAKPEEIEDIRTRFAATDGWEVLGALCDKRLAELDAELEARRAK
jgi:hypothetical protein